MRGLLVEIIGPFTGQYAFLSNFWSVEIDFEGKVYPSVEHAYQAAKTPVLGARTMIRQARTAGWAKRLGRQVPLRPDWEDVKVGIMRALLRSKFAHPELREQLLDTGTAPLVEINTWRDTFWGVYQGRGKNMLGLLLEEVRAELSARG